MNFEDVLVSVHGELGLSISYVPHQHCLSGRILKWYIERFNHVEMHISLSLSWYYREYLHWSQVEADVVWEI